MTARARALCYLAGPPAAGKTTLMTELTRHCQREPRPGPPPHDVLTGGRPRDWSAVEIGRQRETFSGTDALSMSIGPVAVRWLQQVGHTLVLAEGDRLATLGFLGEAAAAGYRVTLVVLEAPPAVLWARCLARGTTQDPAWRAGRETKVQRLAAWVETLQAAAVVRLDTTWAGPGELATAVRAAVPLLDGLIPP